MNDKYQLAKQQGLNWQALVIEDLQEWVKLTVRNMLIEGKSYTQIHTVIHKYVVEQTQDFENEELKARTTNGMEQLTKRVFAYLHRTFGGIGWSLLGALANVSANHSQKVPFNEGTTNRRSGKEYLVRLERDTRLVGYFMETKGIYKHAVPISTFARDYMKRVNDELKFLNEIEAKDVYGERISLRNIAEMTVRHDRQVNNILQLKRDGVRLVYIQPHANCSERCEPWQGKVYSLDGTSGVTDKGVHYEPLEHATDIFVRTRAGRVYKNGCISGFNCLHKLLPYTDNTKIQEIPANIVETERKISKTQRYLERKVRKYRANALQFRGIDDKLYEEYRVRTVQTNRQYITFSKNNKVPYYPSRTEILDNEDYKTYFNAAYLGKW